MSIPAVEGRHPAIHGAPLITNLHAYRHGCFTRRRFALACRRRLVARTIAVTPHLPFYEKPRWVALASSTRPPLRAAPLQPKWSCNPFGRQSVVTLEDGAFGCGWITSELGRHDSQRANRRAALADETPRINALPAWRESFPSTSAAGNSMPGWGGGRPYGSDIAFSAAAGTQALRAFAPPRQQSSPSATHSQPLAGVEQRDHPGSGIQAQAH